MRTPTRPRLRPRWWCRRLTVDFNSTWLRCLSIRPRCARDERRIGIPSSGFSLFFRKTSGSIKGNVELFNGWFSWTANIDAFRRTEVGRANRVSAIVKQLRFPVTSLRLITPISVCRLLLLFGVRVERNVPSFTLQMVMAIEHRVMGQDLRICTWRRIIGKRVITRYTLLPRNFFWSISLSRIIINNDRGIFASDKINRVTIFLDLITGIRVKKFIICFERMASSLN